MDYEFDFDDWSGAKSKKHSTPAKRKLECSLFESGETFERKEPVLLNFMDSDDDDNVAVPANPLFSRSVIESPNVFDSPLRTPDKRQPSPDLFARSPQLEGPKMFPKKLVSWPLSDSECPFGVEESDVASKRPSWTRPLDSPVVSPTAVTPDLSFDGEDLIEKYDGAYGTRFARLKPNRAFLN